MVSLWIKAFVALLVLTTCASDDATFLLGISMPPIPDDTNSTWYARIQVRPASTFSFDDDWDDRRDPHARLREESFVERVHVDASDAMFFEEDLLVRVLFCIDVSPCALESASRAQLTVRHPFYRGTDTAGNWTINEVPGATTTNEIGKCEVRGCGTGESYCDANGNHFCE